MSSSSSRPRWFLLGGMLVFAVLLRLAPQLMVRMISPEHDMKTVNHLWGFTPMLALGLYAGAFIRSRWQAVGLMLLTQLAGDLGIWALSGRMDHAFSWGVYCAYPLCTLLGRPLQQYHSWGRVQAGSFLASTVFFVVSNFGVWAIDQRVYGWEMYPMTWAGLQTCFWMAIPFAKQFIATPIYAALMFSPLGVHSPSPSVPADRSELSLQSV